MSFGDYDREFGRAATAHVCGSCDHVATSSDEAERHSVSVHPIEWFARQLASRPKRRKRTFPRPARIATTILRVAHGQNGSRVCCSGL